MTGHAGPNSGPFLFSSFAAKDCLPVDGPSESTFWQRTNHLGKRSCIRLKPKESFGTAPFLRRAGCLLADVLELSPLPLTAACLSYSTVLFDARTDSGSRRGWAFVFPTLPAVSGAGPVENHIIHRGKRTHYQCHCHGRGDGVAGRRQTGRTPPSENQ